MNRRALLILCLLVAAGAYIHLVKPRPVLLEKPFSEFPLAVGEWRMVREDSFSKSVLAILRPTDYLSRDYEDAMGNRVTLYIGYHGGRKGDGGIHSPKNCLPSSGWFLDSMTAVDVPLRDGGEIEVVNSVMSKGATTVSFYYWFQVSGRVITNEYSLKLAEIWNSLVAMRKDAAFVRLSMPVESGSEEASLVLKRFVADFYPVIRDYLPK
ncbi:EpsI family protein [Pseudodesulfovibrio cashew]|uniref:EpsI family protein n=1 Tax=Pseudodesulfovibrio cashew TaxID=2678688 RepID=A0A6I6J9A0_9BACT|nr:exosortase C-terminal domain/associated protein EpsI [Pseudodesulfovibrio cashew]QGY39175.1 EpsI family protein [Pseudodesulfovibrio cashew]